MVVEDEQAIRAVIEYALKDAGFDVVAVARGDDALRVIADEQIDLVVLDLMLPGVDGLEVCKKLRSNTETSRTPIVLLTYRSGDDIVKRGFESGCTAYLNKPLEDSKLLQTISQYLGDK